VKDTIRLFVGFDQREAAAYHVFCQSVIDKASVPVSFHPLHAPMLENFDGQQDGTNAFIYSRYLVPKLCNYEGWAVFADGDMVAREDIAGLWNLRDDSKAAMVVKHVYKTKHPRKYIGTPIESDNVDYPRKNWSSVVLWNCGHPKNRILAPEFVAEAGGKFLHRFEWLNDDEVGELPKDWNRLVGEDDDLGCAAILHYTLGVPGFQHYRHFPGAENWFRAQRAAMHLIGDRSETER
jgi:lipopolysaccharide biosynthesis glycosyltransferase